MKASRLFVLIVSFAVAACSDKNASTGNEPPAEAGSNAGSGGAAETGGTGGAAGTGGVGGTGGVSPGADAAAGADGGAIGQPTPGIFRICGFTSANGQSCDAIEPYITCVTGGCGAALSQCFGESYATDDFSGGACADYATCATTASDPCTANCTPDATCQQCLGELVACIEASFCTLPLCDGTGADGGAPDAEMAPDGGSPISGTCTDLEACCTQISDANYRAACNQALADSLAAGGDQDCAIVYSTYRAAGICS